MIIRKLRLEKGWSQEQLAEASGVSTRTIQRLERGGQASLESMKCLAAVFETNFNALKQEQDMPEPQILTNEDRAALAKMREWMRYDYGSHTYDPSLSPDEREAMEYVRDIRSFYSNLIGYAVIIPVLVIINLVTNPGYFWAIWPIFGWGIGLVWHGLSVFEIFTPFGDEWEKRQIEKRLRRK